MSEEKGLQFSLSVLVYPLVLVFSMWLVFWAETRFGVNLNRYGVYPQKLEGLRGVLFSPFIHSSLKHLFNNSVPLLVLTTALFYFYSNVKWKVLLFGTLITGVLTWFLGRPAYHIGASGVVYMLVSFLFFKGILSKQFQLTALSLIVVFLYGSLVWYLFPVDEQISWEGHLSGFIVGTVLALLFKKNTIENKKFAWEREDYNPDDDPFLQQFDENGNFIEKPKEDYIDTETIEIVKSPPEASSVKIIYTLKKESASEEKNE
ncbi:rhomboid family intramembrane serine protease [Jejudonia soesokkakensis]|uniref:Rhomboid family intramembrane serine protease n=1 Tax=Jejudonia soesokkakensis TaxID=1323432 RepID=A0ABW2MZE6_9FLAO